MKIVCILFLILYGSFSQAQTKVFTIYFDVNSHDISENNSTTLRLIAELCQSDQFDFLKVFGFTDKSGSTEYNENLSKQRTESVVEKLKQLYDLNSDKLYITWLGEIEYDYDLHFKEAHYQQRCVDIVIQLKSD